MPPTSSLLLVVTGAHPAAEFHDRPVAYGLQQRIQQWLSNRSGNDLSTTPIVPLVVSDVWYLNDEELRRRPTISIGGPATNALTAFLADKLPSAFVIDDQLMVQLDVSFQELMVCAWGQDAAQTAAAVEAFVDRYLNRYLEAIEESGERAE
jgi:hypothetical protein